MDKFMFGLRDKNKDDIRKDDLIEIKYSKKEKCYFKKITTPHKDLNIINPRFEDELTYLKIISQMNLPKYEFKFDYIHSLVQSKYYYDLIDIIMELGINDFTILLIKILNQREIQDYQIAEYLEKIY